MNFNPLQTMLITCPMSFSIIQFNSKCIQLFHNTIKYMRYEFVYRTTSATYRNLFIYLFLFLSIYFLTEGYNKVLRNFIEMLVVNQFWYFTTSFEHQ